MAPIMNLTARIQTFRCPNAAAALPALLLALCLPVAAAPSEGTAGQTVTGRSAQRPDNSMRQRYASTVVAAQTQTKPAWKDLTAAQKQALLPLAPHWDRLGEERKLKWLVISKNYQTLSPDEQAKVHRRMSKWVTLSQQERTQARQNFKQIKTLTPEQKAIQWEAYQALSPDERRKLADQARARPAGVATVKPASKPRLIQTRARKGATSGARMAVAAPPIQQHTLLPRSESESVESERSPYEDEPAE
jgi:hypothetical protein